MGVGVLGGGMAVGAGRGERVLVVCEVDADPPATSFKWKFNNSGETLDVPADRYTSNGSVSILRYLEKLFRPLTINYLISN